MLPEIALFDAEYLLYTAAWHSKDEPLFAESALRGELKLSLEKIKEQGCTKVVICSAGVGKTIKELKYPDYKAHRPNSGEIKETTRRIRPALNEFAEVIEGYEADDVIASLHRQWGQYNVTIVSKDKDLRNLSGYHVNPSSWDIELVDESAAEFNFYLQLLTGDKSDNIEGLRGIGTVKGSKILTGAMTKEEMEVRVQQSYATHMEGKQWYDHYIKTHYLISFLYPSVAHIQPKNIDELLERI